MRRAGAATNYKELQIDWGIDYESAQAYLEDNIRMLTQRDLTVSEVNGFYASRGNQARVQGQHALTAASWPLLSSCVRGCVLLPKVAWAMH